MATDYYNLEQPYLREDAMSEVKSIKPLLILDFAAIF